MSTFRTISIGCLLALFVSRVAFGQSDVELPALLEKVRATHDVPALAAGIVRGGEKPQAAVVGVRKRGTDSRATSADHWHLGSNTKPMTAFLIALLIDLGLLDWDTPLEEVFPEHVADWSDDLKKVTPAHLLTHTSGLPAMGPLWGFLAIRSEATVAEDREKVVKNLAKIKTTSKPGEKYEYSNLGYVVLGAIVDRRGKATWEEQIEKRLFGPLGIKEWGLGAMDKKEFALHPWPHDGKGTPLPEFGVRDNPPVMNSAGRVHVSVGDFNRFLGEVLKSARGDECLLKPATARKSFTNPYSVSPHSLSGWIRKDEGAGGLVLRHDGSNTFNYCTVVVMPDRNLALCVLSNQGGPGGAGAKACHDVREELRASTGSPKK